MRNYGFNLIITLALYPSGYFTVDLFRLFPLLSVPTYNYYSAAPGVKLLDCCFN